MSGAGGQKARRARFAATIPVTLHAGGVDIPVETSNLNREGALLVGEFAVPADPNVEVTLRTPAGDRSVRLRARVMHARADGPTVHVGLRFEPPPPDRAVDLEAIVARVIEGVAAAAFAGIAPGAPLAEVRQTLGRMPTSHRVALAARADPKERELLRLDADPAVLEALARNPHILIHEIRALLRRPDLAPTMLDAVARDPRWAVEEEVRFLVATHPRVTFETADLVASGLPELALQRLLKRPGLHAGVRQKMMAQLAKKHRG